MGHDEIDSSHSVHVAVTWVEGVVDDSNLCPAAQGMQHMVLHPLVYEPCPTRMNSTPTGVRLFSFGHPALFAPQPSQPLPDYPC